jgi:hypothetical protein
MSARKHPIARERLRMTLGEDIEERGRNFVSHKCMIENAPLEVSAQQFRSEDETNEMSEGPSVYRLQMS